MNVIFCFWFERVGLLLGLSPFLWPCEWEEAAHSRLMTLWPDMSPKLDSECFIAPLNQQSSTERIHFEELPEHPPIKVDS